MLADHRGHSAAEDARLLARDLGDRRAQVFVVVEPTGVTTERTGSTTLVASSRPPMPTSSTARSTSARAKCRKAATVIASK